MDIQKQYFVSNEIVLLETSNIIKQICHENGYYIDIKTDINLHEIELNMVEPDLLTEETRHFYPNGINNLKSGYLINRLNYIIKELVANNDNIWIVSHGSLLRKLACISNFIIKRMEEGSCIYLNFKIYNNSEDDINIINNVIDID